MPPTSHRCIACGRSAEPAQTICPYCDEAMYEAPAHRMARSLALVLMIVGGPLLAVLRGCQTDFLWPAPRTALDGVLLALGTGMLLLPARLAGITPVTRMDRLRQVLRPLCGSLLWALTAVLFLLAIRHGLNWTPAAAALAITLPAAMIAFAWLANLPWQGLAAGSLIAAAWHGIPFCLA
jgi:hypothetical protein